MTRARFVAVVCCCLAAGCLWTPPLAAQYPPPACTGTPMFFDVDNSDEFCPWIEQLARDGVVGSCAVGRYCPHAPVTRAQLALLLAKGMREHLWGEGRPGTTLHGDSALTLCDDGEGPRYGLSGHYVRWGEVASACPAGTWVCTLAERGYEPCDTGRPDNESCDARDCQGDCEDFDAGEHRGWLANGDGTTAQGLWRDEQSAAFAAGVCDQYPVWCCRE